jgi:hypothetical protein
MKYRERKKWEEAIKEILRATDEKIEKLPDRPVKKEIKKIREMEDE